MKTFNTYQEAKIANPDSEIFVCKRKSAAYFEMFKAIKKPETSHFINGWKICNPADYCMTLADFLDSGHLLVDGDVVLSNNDAFKNIGKEGSAISFNKRDGNDNIRYVLRAAALEQKPKRTKVEFVQVTESIFNLKDKFERGELYEAETNDYAVVVSESQLANAFCSENLYRRIETEITERDEFIEQYAALCADFIKQKSVVDFGEYLADSGKFKLADGE
jgi:hypothetical protein